MKFKAKSLSGEVLDVEVDDNATVEHAKESIGNIKNESIENIKIIYNGQILENINKLTDCGVTENCTVVILIKKPKVQQPVQQSSFGVGQVPTMGEQPSFGVGQVPTMGDQVQPPLVQPFPNIFNNLPVSGQQQPFPNIFNNLPTVSGQQQPFPNIISGSESAGNMLNQFQNQLEQNPQLFSQLLMQNPFINQFAQQNPEQFQQIINDPNFVQNVIQSTSSGFDEPEQGDNMESTISLTKEEKEDVDFIVNMGFSATDAYQYYFACEKNKELAVNMLMENKYFNED